MKHSKQSLVHFWHLVHKRPRWMIFLKDRVGLDVEDWSYLEKIDDDFLSATKHHRHQRPDPKSFEVDAFWAKSRRRAYFIGKHGFDDGTLRWEAEDKNLDNDRVESARAYPLQELVKSKRILCPLHKDTKPSMSTEKGFGFCFSCGGSIDSIGYLMKVEGKSFVEAVNTLCEMGG